MADYSSDSSSSTPKSPTSDNEVRKPSHSKTNQPPPPPPPKRGRPKKPEDTEDKGAVTLVNKDTEGTKVNKDTEGTVKTGKKKREPDSENVPVPKRKKVPKIEEVPKDEAKDEAKNEVPDEKDKVSSKPRKGRDVPPKPSRFVLSDDNYAKYVSYMKYLLERETFKQWSERMNKEKRRQIRMGKDWKKKGDVDITASIDKYTNFLANKMDGDDLKDKTLKIASSKAKDYDFAEFDGKWLRAFGFDGEYTAEELSNVDLGTKPLQFRTTYVLFAMAKKRGFNPLGIYGAKLDTYDKSNLIKMYKDSSETIYVGSRISLKNLDAHPLSLPTKLKVYVQLDDDMKLGVGAEDF